MTNPPTSSASLPLKRQAHQWLKGKRDERGQDFQCSLDATCGHGKDALFLAQFTMSHLYCFDIQAQAIQATQELLMHAKPDCKISCIQDDHQRMAYHLKGEMIDAAMMNLGYLPRADQRITTKASSTVKALTAIEHHLSDHGVLTVMCYPGHPHGQQETKAVASWLNQTSTSMRVVDQRQSEHAQSPVLFLCEKSSTGL